MKHRLVVVVAVLALVFAVQANTASQAADPAGLLGGSGIQPGVQTVTGGAQCTSNFVFEDRAGQRYLGQAAHCSGLGTSTDLDGCTTGSLPLGTPVAVQGATRPGTLAYSSWTAMQAVGEQDEEACAFNDFALVRLDPADHGLVNPSVPVWGGPTGLSAGAVPGSVVYGVGNSSLHLGLTVLNSKVGVLQATSDGGWQHTVFSVLPGIPGDSGGPYLDAAGNALGTLSTLSIGGPSVVSNGVGDMAKQLAYAQAHSGLPGIDLVQGTAPFNSGQLPLDLANPLGDIGGVVCGLLGC
ncbi:MAG: serine protease [Acidimicrobiia bacterium]